MTVRRLTSAKGWGEVGHGIKHTPPCHKYSLWSIMARSSSNFLFSKLSRCCVTIFSPFWSRSKKGLDGIFCSSVSAGGVWCRRHPRASHWVKGVP